MGWGIKRLFITQKQASLSRHANNSLLGNACSVNTDNHPMEFSEQKWSLLRKTPNWIISPSEKYPKIFTGGMFKLL